MTTIRVGPHRVQLERDEQRVHLVLGGVFRLVMTLDEAAAMADVLMRLTVAKDPVW